MPEENFKTTFKQKLLLLGFGLLITLSLCEVVLRLGEWTFTSLQELRNYKYYGQKNLYTIMCIGESTTALGGDHSYPSILEKILNQQGGEKTFRVFNAGRPSVQSDYIVDHLENQIKQYHPDMVLAMVGVNDSIYGHIEYDHQLDKLSKEKWYHFYHHLKIYSVYTYFKDSVVNYFNKLRIRHELTSKNMVSMPAPSPRININGIDDFSRFMYAHQLIMEGFTLRQAKKQQEAIELYKQAIYLYPKNVDPYMEYINTLTEMHDKESVRGVYQLAIANNPQSDWGYAGLSNYYRQKGMAAVADEYESKAVACRKIIQNSDLMKNYQKIKEILDDHKIKLICVQYPMREVDSLKRFFKDSGSMVFVDNEKIFKAAVQKFGYYALFEDTAAGDFGHGTAQGNTLLAENIKKVVLNNMK